MGRRRNLKLFCCSNIQDLSPFELDSDAPNFPLMDHIREFTRLYAQRNRRLDFFPSAEVDFEIFAFGVIKLTRRNASTDYVFTAWLMCHLRAGSKIRAPFAYIPDLTGDGVVRDGLLVASGEKKVCGACAEHSSTEYTLERFERRGDDGWLVETDGSASNHGIEWLQASTLGKKVSDVKFKYR